MRKGLGFRGIGFRDLGFRAEGFRGLEMWVWGIRFRGLGV